ncbi:MAG: pantoate--beta-alanine ligase [Cryobacterium sp.]
MTVLTRPEFLGTIAEARHFVDDARNRAQSLGRHGPDSRVVLVPTMGALHAGHLSLVRRARTLGDTVIVSIFVNPLQFGAGEDLAGYPRTVDADIVLLAEQGVDAVFVPTAGEMYPDGAAGTRVNAGAVGTLLEGAARPGHFDGMLTVVAKLINIVGPDVVMFGQKDAQQVFLVQRMVADLNMRTTIEVGDIVREANGLALSSRNRYLSEAEGNAAVSLSAGLAAAAAITPAGPDCGPAAVIAAARALIDTEPLVKLDYLEVVHPQTFQSVAPDHRGPARMLVAALVGRTRLIDNTLLTL